MFLFNDTATSEIYTLSLHDALPISMIGAPTAMAGATLCATRFSGKLNGAMPSTGPRGTLRVTASRDRKSTRLNSSHANISYAVFCLKKNTAAAAVGATSLLHLKRAQ